MPTTAVGTGSTEKDSVLSGSTLLKNPIHLRVYTVMGDHLAKVFFH